MKTLIFVSLVALATLCFACQSYGQGSLAPLYLFTNGSGSISPLQNGQLLEVGQSYDMTAIPDSGYAFSSWQPVNVFVETSVYTNSDGIAVTNPPEMIANPVPAYTETPSLTFTMQPTQVLVDMNGTFASVSIGWQANFEAIPEPSDIALIFLGFTAVVLLGCVRRQVRTKCCLTLPGTNADCPLRLWMV